ncbi:MAG: SipW-dependent-type signal peptide-containing protein [Oscillospiraceae bacterium]|nr:SipW-dependent-type signal peptide-containing protein [Oscillospiraceae bacterium]
MKKKTLALVLALTLLVAGVVGGTLAWLTDRTAEVKNTFTVGDINIDLTETTADYKMVPGNTIAKDPTVTVKANSETCWLFVEVTESENLNNFITYTIANGWTELESGVYYREVSASNADQTFPVLAGNTVTVKSDVTKTMLETAKTDAPTLTFKAYAIQRDHFATAAAAWAEVSK